jgi:acetyltransferase
MLDRAASQGVHAKDVRGFLIQKMAPKGEEIIVGCTDDGKFGPLLMFGLGGVAVEVWRDVSFRICPLTDKDAAQMIREVHGFRMLDGYRGARKSDVRAIETILERLSELVTRFPRIVEFDLNPIRVFKEGEGAMVLDARVRIDAER